MVELVHSGLPPAQEQRMIRVMNDVCILRAALTRTMIRTEYTTLEKIRDEISKMLDKADGKHA